MIVAFLALCFSLVKLLLNTNTIPLHLRNDFYIGLAILSGMPIILQFLIFLGELSRAGIKMSIKLVCHRLFMLFAGDYGASSSLLLKQYSNKEIGAYPKPKNWVWLCILILGHFFTKPFTSLVFGDPFSGIYTVRYTSLALWLGAEGVWDHIVKPKIDDDIFSKTYFKDVRHLNLVVEFKEQRPRIIRENSQPTRDPRSIIVNSVSNAINQPRTEVQPMTERKPELEQQSQPTTEGQSSTGSPSTTKGQPSTVAHPTSDGQPSTVAHPTSDGQPMTKGQLLPTMEGQSRTGSHLNNDGGQGLQPQDVSYHKIANGGQERQSQDVSYHKIANGGQERQSQDVSYHKIAIGGQEPQPQDVSYDIIAKGNQASLVSQLYYETWKGDCTKENAREFLTFLEILNNDTFVVNDRPPDENDQILTCIELSLIVESILEKGKKVNARRVFGMTYE